MMNLWSQYLALVDELIELEEYNIREGGIYSVARPLWSTASYDLFCCSRVIRR